MKKASKKVSVFLSLFALLPLAGRAEFATRRVVATAAEKTGAWADAVVAEDDAFSAIQPLIDASLPGDTILVKAGRYVLTNELSFSDSRCGVTLRSDDGTGRLARQTTVFAGGYPVTSNRFVNCAAEGTVIEGFTFTNGYVDATCGGAVWFSRADAKTRISDCDFLGNTAWWGKMESSSSPPADQQHCVKGSGGALFIEGSGLVSNCLFRGNVAFAGAGVQTKSSLTVVSPVTSVPHVTQCAFVENMLRGAGYNGTGYGCGAGVCAYGSVVVDHSTFTSNCVNNERGQVAACCATEGGTVSNCTFEAQYGAHTKKYPIYNILSASRSRACTMIRETLVNISIGGTTILDGHTYSNCTYNASQGSYTMRNCLFIDNVVDSDFGIVYTKPGAKSYIDNCTFIRNTKCFRSTNGGGMTNFVNNCVFFNNDTIHHATNEKNAEGAYFVMSNCVYAGQFSNRKGAIPTPVTVNCRTNLTVETAKFVDAEHGDWRLQRKSPLRDAGVKLDWMTAASTDRDQLPRLLDKNGKPSPTALPDIGCYECAILTQGMVLVVR